jgi:signal peptidase II
VRRAKLTSLILPAVAALVLAADQVSKHAVRTRLEVGQSWEIASWLAPVFRITHVTNTGVAFGMFKNMGDFFTIVAAVVIVAILIYYRNLPTGAGLLRVALGLQLGGAMGNLADRLVHGQVLDFVDLSFWPLQEFAVFNVADASIVSGVTILTILLLWEEKLERDKRRTGEGAQQAAKGG